MYIGLVLSGGMGKDAYQVSALTAIDVFFNPFEFKYVSAESIGVLNMYTYLTNNLSKAREVWKLVNLKGKKRFIMSILKSTFFQEIITTIVLPERIDSNFLCKFSVRYNV